MEIGMTKLAHFYVDCDELRDAGIRVHEEITGIMRPPSIKALMERVRIAYEQRERTIMEGKCAETEGDHYLSESCRREVELTNEVFGIWKSRWRAA